MVQIQLAIKQTNPEQVDDPHIEIRCETFAGEYPTEGELKIAKAMQETIQSIMQLVTSGMQAEHGPDAAHYEIEQDMRPKEEGEHTAG